MRMRGLKSPPGRNDRPGQRVASLADAWIEICYHIPPIFEFDVASLADAWIEIFNKEQIKKYLDVASLADAWIEIFKTAKDTTFFVRRIPCGCVD